MYRILLQQQPEVFVLGNSKGNKMKRGKQQQKTKEQRRQWKALDHELIDIKARKPNWGLKCSENANARADG